MEYFKNRHMPCIRVIALIVIMLFTFNNIAWADPSFGTDTLQVKTLIAHLSPESFLGPTLQYLARAVRADRFNDLKGHIYPLIDGYRLHLFLDGKEQAGDTNKWIIPCAIDINANEVIEPDEEYTAVLDLDDDFAISIKRKMDIKSDFEESEEVVSLKESQILQEVSVPIADSDNAVVVQTNKWIGLWTMLSGFLLFLMDKLDKNPLEASPKVPIDIPEPSLQFAIGDLSAALLMIIVAVTVLGGVGLYYLLNYLGVWGKIRAKRYVRNSIKERNRSNAEVLKRVEETCREIDRLEGVIVRMSEGENVEEDPVEELKAILHGIHQEKTRIKAIGVLANILKTQGLYDHVYRGTVSVFLEYEKIHPDSQIMEMMVDALVDAIKEDHINGDVFMDVLKGLEGIQRKQKTGIWAKEIDVDLKRIEEIVNVLIYGRRVGNEMRKVVLPEILFNRAARILLSMLQSKNDGSPERRALVVLLRESIGLSIDEDTPHKDEFEPPVELKEDELEEPLMPSLVTYINEGGRLKAQEVEMNPGDVIRAGNGEGNFVLEHELGRGGAAVVYQARRRADNKVVAIKFISRATPSARERFKREVKALKGISGENVVGVLAYGEHEGIPYVVEDAVGEPLDRVIRKGAITERRAGEIVKGLLTGLEMVHGKGIAHRDVKPSNAVVCSDGTPKLVDFGLAKDMDEMDGSLQLSVAGTMVGTPVYASPEQLLGQDVDNRTDVYSMGCLLYQMLTRELPFETGTQAAVAMKKMKFSAQTLKDRGVEITPLMSVAIKAMLFPPETRFQTAEAMLEAVELAMTWVGVPEVMTETKDEDAEEPAEEVEREALDPAGRTETIDQLAARRLRQSNEVKRERTLDFETNKWSGLWALVGGIVLFLGNRAEANPLDGGAFDLPDF